MQMYPGYQPMYPGAYPTRLQQPQQTAPMAQSMMTPVTSREQAVVAQIPFDGNPYFFFNTANDEIYGKRFDPSTGQSPLVVYKREQPTQETAFAPLALVQQLAQQMQGMQEQIQALQPRPRKTASKEDDAA